MEKWAKEGWTGHFRRHFRRPKVSSRDETHALSAAELPLSAAESPFLTQKPSFRGQGLAAETASTRGSAAEPCFGGRTWILQKGRIRAQLMLPASKLLSNTHNMHTNTSQRTYHITHAYRGLKTSSSPKNNNKTHMSNICSNSCLYPNTCHKPLQNF